MHFIGSFLKVAATTVGRLVIFGFLLSRLDLNCTRTPIRNHRELENVCVFPSGNFLRFSGGFALRNKYADAKLLHHILQLFYRKVPVSTLTKQVGKLKPKKK